MAQRRGFEPPVGFRPTHDFQPLRNSRKGLFLCSHTHAGENIRKDLTNKEKRATAQIKGIPAQGMPFVYRIER